MLDLTEYRARQTALAIRANAVRMRKAYWRDKAMQCDLSLADGSILWQALPIITE